MQIKERGKTDMPYPHQTDKKEPGQKGGPVEILSPAGSLDILKCAFAAGADAVYALSLIHI